jgi:hypothetical protein
MRVGLRIGQTYRAEGRVPSGPIDNKGAKCPVRVTTEYKRKKINTRRDPKVSNVEDGRIKKE